MADFMRLRRYERLEGLDEDAARAYYAAKEGALGFLNEVAIKPFEEAAKALTGYGKQNLPSGKKVAALITLNSCGIGIAVMTVPKTSVGYEDVYRFVFGREGPSLLDSLESRATGKKWCEIIDDDIYIEAGFLRDQILGALDGAKTPGLSQSVIYRPDIHEGKTVVLPKSITTAGMDTVAFPIMDYSRIATETAEWHLRALEFADQTERDVVDPFEEMLKERTGYSSDNIPARTTMSPIPLGNHMFIVTTAPRRRTAWGRVMNALAKMEGETVSGELQGIAENDIDESSEIYHVERRHGRNFVSLSSLRSRGETLARENTTLSVEQKIAYYPGSI